MFNEILGEARLVGRRRSKAKLGKRGAMKYYKDMGRKIGSKEMRG